MYFTQKPEVPLYSITSEKGGSLMRIATGNVALSSQRSYYKKVDVRTETLQKNERTGLTRATVNYLSTEVREGEFGLNYEDTKGNSLDMSGESKTYTLKSVRGQSASMVTGGMSGLENKVFTSVFDRLLDMLKTGFGNTKLSLKDYLGNRTSGKSDNLMAQMFDIYTSSKNNPDISSFAGGGQNLVTETKRVSSSLVEAEAVQVQAGGYVQTEDGRSISFGVTLNMSRAFASQVNIETTQQVVMTDPLVINMDNLPAGTRDMTFQFDIDCDGKMDEISMLREGSGFLALDKNGDGKINDGSELFGTKSGNGFSDLAVYDEDGNGWIDENDEIFSKLRIWSKDKDGNDVLKTLKEADVGAIYLGSTTSQFSITDQKDNTVQGAVRATGIYLKESTGTAGTVQQVDLANRTYTA